MKIGVCTPIENIGKVREMGFDYIEPSVVSIMKLDKASYEEWVGKVKTSSIKCEAFNILLPGGIKVTGPDADLEKLVAYFTEAFGRVSRLGGQTVVFGSGGARNCPEGWSQAQAVKQFEEACRLAGEAAAAYGITVVVEPLNKRECNLINTVREGHDLVRRVAHPSVRLLADFYHMRLEDEEMDAIGNAGEVLKHFHIANSFGRGFPFREEEDGYRAFIGAMQEIGYQGRLSIEGNTNHFDADAPASLAFLRSLTG